MTTNLSIFRALIEDFQVYIEVTTKKKTTTPKNSNEFFIYRAI